VLARIQDGFHTMIQSRRGETQRIEISCFFEEMPLVGVGLVSFVFVLRDDKGFRGLRALFLTQLGRQVVPQDSAILPGYIPIGIRANHMDMTKFVALDDPGFLAVCGELRRWIKQLAKTPAPRADPIPPPLPAPVVPSQATLVNALPESQSGQGAPLSIASPPSAAAPANPDLVAALQRLTTSAASAPLDAASIHSLRDALIFPVGWTTLHGAAYRGDVEGIRNALVAGEDPNKTTVPKLWTPLWVAACYGQTEVAELLLEAGANANAAIRTGSTAVREAAIIGSTGVLALLIAKGANLELCPPATRDTALICAASKGHYEAVRLLVEGGANINAQQNGGWAALHYALHNKDEGMFRLLLQHSADTNIATTTGRRPLHFAALRGLTAQAEDLLGRGAHMDPTDRHGLTPLLLAVQAGNLETVQLLVNRGARTDITDTRRQTLLNVAYNSGRRDVHAWLAQRRIR
jgi:ankyrin repeat protein